MRVPVIEDVCEEGMEEAYIVSEDELYEISGDNRRVRLFAEYSKRLLDIDLANRINSGSEVVRSHVLLEDGSLIYGIETELFGEDDIDDGLKGYLEGSSTDFVASEGYMSFYSIHPAEDDLEMVGKVNDDFKHVYHSVMDGA